MSPVRFEQHSATRPSKNRKSSRHIKSLQTLFFFPSASARAQIRYPCRSPMRAVLPPRLSSCNTLPACSLLGRTLVPRTLACLSPTASLVPALHGFLLAVARYSVQGSQQGHSNVPPSCGSCLAPPHPTPRHVRRPARVKAAPSAKSAFLCLFLFCSALRMFPSLSWRSSQ